MKSTGSWLLVCGRLATQICSFVLPSGPEPCVMTVDAQEYKEWSACTVGIDTGAREKDEANEVDMQQRDESPIAYMVYGPRSVSHCVPYSNAVFQGATRSCLNSTADKGEGSATPQKIQRSTLP